MKSTKALEKSPVADKFQSQPESKAFLTDLNSSQPQEKEKKTVLETSGILDAYNFLLKEVCRYGLPKGNVYEFAAISILKYERKMKAERANRMHALQASRDLEKIKEHAKQTHSLDAKVDGIISTNFPKLFSQRP